MMKKITRIAALLATTALLLAGFPACGDDDGDEEPTLAKIEISIDTEKVITEYAVGAEFDKTGITVTATYSDGSTKDVTDKATFTATTSEGKFTTATAGKYNVTLTATYEGKTDTATREITVKDDSSANGGGTGDGNDSNDDDKENGGNDEGEGGGGDGNGEGNLENPPEEIPEGLTVAQKVTDEAVTETGWYQTTANTSGNIVQKTADGAISVNIKDNTCPTPEYILKDAMSGAVKITATFNITTAENSCGIMEILGADGNALFQPARIKDYNTASGITITSRAGSGSENTVKSPTIALGTNFTVETTINFDAGKFQTKVGDTSLPVQTFSGEGKALKAIKFNPKTSGTVMTISGVTVTDVAEADIPDDLKPTVFESKTATVTNDEATLGITATEVTSDNEAVATVEPVGNEGIKITSVKPGVATITAKADDKTATIKVTVADDGAITTSIRKYTAPGAVNATFSMISNIGEGKALGAVNSSAANLDADITAESGSTGATLHFTGNVKVESNALNVQKTTGSTTENYATGDSKVAKGFFNLVLDDSAIVKVHYKASGSDSDTSRIIGITKVDNVETKIQSANVAQASASEADFVTDSKLEAGTYKIYCNGVKIYSVKCGTAAEE